MSDTIRDEISTYRERQMDRRKREREERLGITNDDTEEVGKDEKPNKKRQKKETKEEIKIKLEQQQEEEEKKRRKPLKYPAEGESLLLLLLLLPISYRCRLDQVSGADSLCRLFGGIW